MTTATIIITIMVSSLFLFALLAAFAPLGEEIPGVGFVRRDPNDDIDWEG